MRGTPRAREEAAGGGTECQAGTPGFSHVNRCPGIIPVWHSSLTHAFPLAAPGKDLAYAGPVWASLSPAIALCQPAGQQAPASTQNSLSPWGSPGKAAAPTLPAQGARTPGTPNRSLLQHLHSSSNPLPFSSPVISDLRPPVLGMGTLGRCGENIWLWERKPPVPADLQSPHCTREAKSQATQHRAPPQGNPTSSKTSGGAQERFRQRGQRRGTDRTAPRGAACAIRARV